LESYDRKEGLPRIRNVVVAVLSVISGRRDSFSGDIDEYCAARREKRGVRAVKPSFIYD